MRIVIAEDQILLREGLARLFADAGHTVVACLGDCTELPSAVSALAPELVILDIRMPPTFTDEGARAAATLKRDHPGLGVLLLSQHIETARTTGLITLPGFGYLLKDRVLDVGDFLAAAERVSRGGSALDPHVVASLIARRDTSGPLATLTEREHEVLDAMAQGLTNAGIAKRLHLSDRTVEAHINHLLGKLDLSDPAEGHRRVLAVLAYLGAERVEEV